MSPKIERIEGTKFKASVGGFEIITGRVSDDEPPEGMAAGAVPFAAIGLCTGTASLAPVFFINHDMTFPSLQVLPWLGHLPSTTAR
jgi:hypothetical protein